MGPLGRKVVTPNPPFSAVGGAERGVRGHNFSTQWSHCFGFGPSRSPFLVLASPGAHFWFWEALKGGLGVTTFRPNGPTVLVLAPPGACLREACPNLSPCPNLAHFPLVSFSLTRSKPCEMTSDTKIIDSIYNAIENVQ